MKALNQYGFIFSLLIVSFLDNKDKILLSFRSLLFYINIL